MLIYTYTCSCRIHTDAMNKRQAKTSLEKYVPLTLLLGFKKGYSGFYCERELETKQNCNVLTPTLMAVSVVSFSFSRASQPEAQGLSFLLSAGFLYHILSSTGLQNYWGPQGPLRPGVDFPTTPYQQLLWTPTHQGSRRPLQPGVAFPTTSHLYSVRSLTV